MAPNLAPGQRYRPPAELPCQTGSSDARFAQSETGETLLLCRDVSALHLLGLTTHLPLGVQVGLGVLRDGSRCKANTSANPNDAEQLADMVATGMRLRDAVLSAELTMETDPELLSCRGHDPQLNGADRWAGYGTGKAQGPSGGGGGAVYYQR